MSNIKLLGQKRESPFISRNNNNVDDIKFPEVNYVNYKEEEICSLNENELISSWNQEYKNSKNLPLNNEIFKNEKNAFLMNFQLFKPIKKYYLKEKIRSDIDLSKNEKEYIYHCLETKDYSIKQIIEMNKSKNIQFKKYNMILDIDGTIIKAIEPDDKNFIKKESDFEVKGTIYNNMTFHYIIRYRPYLFQFISELKDYFNFYISTLGHINYANKIMEDLKRKTNISIPPKNIISNISEDKNIAKLAKTLEEIKFLDYEEGELNNTVIIDDVINYWIKPPNLKKTEKDLIHCIKSLIPSKRYIAANEPIGQDTNNFGILIHNDILDGTYDANKDYSIDVGYQYCIEKDSNIEGVSQLFYIETFLKKCIKFSLFSGISLVNAMEFYRKKIFEDCKFNLKYYPNETSYFFISSIIKELGGTIVTNVDETTHFITENKINMNNIVNKKNQNLIFINVNYIFQCYFNLNRMHEDEKQFKSNTY